MQHFVQGQAGVTKSADPIFHSLLVSKANSHNVCLCAMDSSDISSFDVEIFRETLNENWQDAELIVVDVIIQSPKLCRCETVANCFEKRLFRNGMETHPQF